MNKNKTYGVACSGGPDSVYLVRYLYKKKFKNILVLHVNYNYRTTSYLDEKYTVEICEKCNYKYKILRLNNVKPTSNLQNISRNIRYKFFSENLSKPKIIFVAHQKNDFYENIFLHQRFKYKKRYPGLKFKNHINMWSLTIIRPLITSNKKKIIKKLKKDKINYAVDITNFESLYIRNQVRKEIENIFILKKIYLILYLYKNLLTNLSFNCFYSQFLKRNKKHIDDNIFTFKKKNKIFLLIKIKIFLESNGIFGESYLKLKNIKAFLLNEKNHNQVFLLNKNYGLKKKIYIKQVFIYLFNLNE